MNKLFKWGIALCWAALIIPLCFEFSRMVSAQTLKLFGLEHWNPNNVIGSLTSLMVVLSLIAKVLARIKFWIPLYNDLVNLIGAAVLKNPHALAQSRSMTSSQAAAKLKLFFYPKLKLLAATLLILLFFTVVFPPPLALLSVIYLVFIVSEAFGSNVRPLTSAVRGFTRRYSADLAAQWKGKDVRGFLRWGGSYIAKANEPLHYLLLGTTGAGKSLWMETMMATVLPASKGIINDPKPSRTDGMVPLLESLKSSSHSSCNCHLLLNLFTFSLIKT